VIFRAGAWAELVEKFVETQLTHTLEWKVGFFVFLAAKVGFEANLVVRVLTHDEPLGWCGKFSIHRKLNECWMTLVDVDGNGVSLREMV